MTDDGFLAALAERHLITTSMVRSLGGRSARTIASALPVVKLSVAFSAVLGTFEGLLPVLSQESGACLDSAARPSAFRTRAN